MGLGYALATVSEVVVLYLYSAHVQEVVVVQYLVHVWEVVVVRYSVHREMVVRYLVHGWVAPFFVQGGEAALSVHVREAAEAGRGDLLPTSNLG